MAGTLTKVLVIEPDLDVREMIADLFSLTDYHVEPLPEEGDAVAFSERIRPKVIMIGIRPTIPEDRQIVEDLQGNPRTRAIPVVVTSTSEKVVAEAADCANVRETLVAPYDLTTLEQAVATALGEQPADGGSRCN